MGYADASYDTLERFPSNPKGQPVYGFLLFADGAAAHEDKTISMVRSGISELNATDGPAAVRLALVVLIDSQVGDDGNHVILIKATDQDGETVFESNPSPFDIEGERLQRVLSVVQLGLVAKKTGWWDFDLLVDENVLFRKRIKINIQKVHSDAELAKLAARNE